MQNELLLPALTEKKLVHAVAWLDRTLLGRRIEQRLQAAVAAQVADGTRAAELIDNVAQRFGRLDTLILNASTALGRDADARYALSLNRDAQRRLVELALPLMPAGGHIVFVTSHQAHFYPNKAVRKGYATVAASLRAAVAELEADGVRRKEAIVEVARLAPLLLR